jgi:UDP-2,4-diacetamido-2,4,6-trideoxy-beta-L-altropyranose hydrolase
VGDGLKGRALLVADAGPSAGLGHVSRSSAVAIALRTRGFTISCLAHGANAPLQVDGVVWDPVESLQDLVEVKPSVLVLDSYLLQAHEVRLAAEPGRLVVMHDANGYPSSADLVVALSGVATNQPMVLAGSRYACLRPAYWGLPPRAVSDVVRVVLVAAGSTGTRISELTEATRRALPNAKVRVVRGPFDTSASDDDGSESVAGENSLLGQLLAADLVVSAAGQTLIEALATGAPTIGVAVVKNQRRQLAYLAGIGAALPADAENLEQQIRKVGEDLAERRRLARTAQANIDGYGALRVAFVIARSCENGSA